MTYAILEIDHLMTFVEDGAAAAATYQAMGFTMTPSSHIASMGIINQIVLLHSRTLGAANFIELMGVADADLLPTAMRVTLSGQPGIKSMVMATEDARETQRALLDAGYPFEPPQHVRREWILPGEGSVWPEFDVLLPIPAPLAFNVCQYHNLSLYQRDNWQTHANTAKSILSCFAIAPDPRESIAYFEKLFGRSAIRSADGALAVSPGVTEIAIYSHDQFFQAFGISFESAVDQFYAGFRIGVADMGALRNCLRASLVPHRDDGCRIVVGPGFACGNVIEFVTMP